MNETLKSLVVECVERNVLFQGSVGTAYTVQELFHTVNLTSINSIYSKTKKTLESMNTDSLFDTKNSTKEKALKLQVDTLKEVFLYKQEAEKAAKNAEKKRIENSERLIVLKKIKTEKELEELKAMSAEDIQKEIEKYS